MAKNILPRALMSYQTKSECTLAKLEIELYDVAAIGFAERDP
jgi:hypothetical protein